MDGLYHKSFFKCCIVIPTGPWTARAHAGKGSKGKGRHAVKTRSRARGKPSSQVRLRVHCIGSLLCRPTRPAHGSNKCTCSAFGLDTCLHAKDPSCISKSASARKDSPGSQRSASSRQVGTVEGVWPLSLSFFRQGCGQRLPSTSLSLSLSLSLSYFGYIYIYIHTNTRTEEASGRSPPSRVRTRTCVLSCLLACLPHPGLNRCF